MDPVAQLRAAVQRGAGVLRGGQNADSVPVPTVERPKRSEQGDYATNAAMLLAPKLGEAPREIASRLGDELSDALGDELVRFDIAGPGFLNLFLSDAWHRDALRFVLDAGSRFAAGGAARPERILLEFVSANPTGVLVAASGRHAAYGDSLARILEHHGHTVSREYYFNDAGSQVRRLGESVRARALHRPVPEDGYHGDYVTDLAATIPDAADESVDVDVVAAQAVAILLDKIKSTLIRYGVHFDNFFSRANAPRGLAERARPRDRGAARRPATSTAATARSGCGRRRSGTTRIECCCVRGASRPTSRPTSPTCRTSAIAASSASCSRSEPITTGTSPD